MKYVLFSQKMKDYMRTLGLFALAALIGLSSCNNGNRSADDAQEAKNNSIASQNDGVVLKIEDADLIQVDFNPQYNTAEWQFMVNKAGRYDVWLSSLTCDTAHLHFDENVVITAGDTRLAKIPVGDEIVKDDRSVKEPWYRADSHMGSIFFSEPGEYQVQVISDKVEPHPSDPSAISIEKHTLINSVILKPMVN
jgi:hypothetical protein